MKTPIIGSQEQSFKLGAVNTITNLKLNMQKVYNLSLEILKPIAKVIGTFIVLPFVLLADAIWFLSYLATVLVLILCVQPGVIHCFEGEMVNDAFLPCTRTLLPL